MRCQAPAVQDIKVRVQSKGGIGIVTEGEDCLDSTGVKQ